MNVYLSENGDQLPSDVVLKWVGRSDLTPVPRSIEFTAKLIDGVQEKLKVGASFWSGRENLRYGWSRPTGRSHWARCKAKISNRL